MSDGMLLIDSILGFRKIRENKKILNEINQIPYFTCLLR